MHHGFLAKFIFGQLVLSPFDLETIGAREIPEVAFLVADTTVASVSNLYFGQLDSVLERSAVAVAIVSNKFFFFSHWYEVSE